jgi:flagellar biosynthesis protein FlhF
MATKTFRAETLIKALQQVQHEFGPDAMVLSVREVPSGPAWQIWRQPGCEVIATTNPGKKTEAPAAPSAPATPDTGSSARQDELPEGIEWIEEPLKKNAKSQQATAGAEKPAAPPEKKQAHTKTAMPWLPPKLHDYDEELLTTPQFGAANEFDEIFLGLSKSSTASKKEVSMEEKKPDGVLQDILEALSSVGLSETLKNHLAQVCMEAASPTILFDKMRCRDYVKRQLETMIRTIPQYIIDHPGKVICVIGPNGSGKTSSCARLTAYYMQRGRKVSWINTDTMRAGAIAEARSYSEALNIPLRLAYLPEDLPGLIASENNADLIMVDTAGYNPYQEAQITELGAFLTQIPNRTTYVMASAAMKEKDLNQCLAAVRVFNVNGMVVTKVDETSTPAGIYNFANQNQLPVAFICRGKQVTSDFSPACSIDLVDVLFKKGGER